VRRSLFSNDRNDLQLSHCVRVCMAHNPTGMALKRKVYQKLDRGSLNKTSNSAAGTFRGAWMNHGKDAVYRAGYALYDVQNDVFIDDKILSTTSAQPSF